MLRAGSHGQLPVGAQDSATTQQAKDTAAPGGGGLVSEHRGVSQFASNAWSQYRTLLGRELLSITRNPFDVAGRTLTFAWVGIVMGILYYGMPVSGWGRGVGGSEGRGDKGRGGRVGGACGGVRAAFLYASCTCLQPSRPNTLRESSRRHPTTCRSSLAPLLPPPPAIYGRQRPQPPQPCAQLLSFCPLRPPPFDVQDNLP